LKQCEKYCKKPMKHVAQQTNLFSQFTIVVIPVPLAMAIVATNVLWIPLPKFHDGDDAITHIGRLTKVCVTNGEDIGAKKLQYFPTTLWGKSVGWFTRYEIANLAVTWGEVQRAFISRFSNVRNERQAIVALNEVKQ
jgi:hypothetical protein